jgi:molybdopterin-guanine dinucleotide biosynthesis protein A
MRYPSEQKQHTFFRRPAPCDVAGAILAGGKARRMGGVPKGTLRTGSGVPLIERLLAQMSLAGVGEVVISANRMRPYADLGFTIVSDTRADSGPLAGVEAALRHFGGRYDAVLCVPSDMPALSSAEMLTLMRSLAARGERLVFAETDGPQKHPLCAVIRTDLLDSVSTALDRGAFGVSDLWRRLGGATVHFENSDTFVNLNSLDDVNAWLAETRNRDGHNE